MSAFVLQNDSNQRGERWLSRPPQLHKRDTTISCKSNFLNARTNWSESSINRGATHTHVSRATRCK